MENFATSKNSALSVPTSQYKPKVAMVDPANFVSYYSEALINHMSETDITLFTSPFRFTSRTPKCATRFIYFPLEKHLQIESKILRTFLRIIQLPLNHLVLFFILYRESFKIVHLQWSRVPILDLLFVKALKLAGLQVIYTVHDVEPLYTSAGSRWVHRKLLQSVDDTVVLSHWAKAKLISRYALEKVDNIHVIPHGPMRSGAVIPKETARYSLQFPKDQFQVLFFGSIKDFKGIDLLLETARLCSLNKNVTVKFCIVGLPDGSQMKEKIEKASKEYRNIECVLQYIPDSQEANYFCACDIVALPYNKISQSGVMSTAIAYQRPVIATDVGNFREMIEECGNGLILPNDAKNWAETIANLAQGSDANPSQIMQWQVASVQAAKGRYSWSNIGSKTKSLYEK